MPEPTKLDLDDTLLAHRLTASVDETTRWPLETWVIRESDMTPLAQVQIYFYAKDQQWHLWTASIVSQKIKRLGMRLQDARNREE